MLGGKKVMDWPLAELKNDFLLLFTFLDFPEDI
jgi:hypothetical protein